MQAMLLMIPTLSHLGPVPVYQQIRDWMHSQITSNAWPEHYKLQPRPTSLKHSA